MSTSSTKGRGGRRARGSGAPPLQLELFAPRLERLTLRDAPAAAAAVSRALAQGGTVGLVRAPRHFELLLARDGEGDPRGLELLVPLGAPCGLSRRAVELLVRGAGAGERGLWARPAGGGWAGWTEWGRLQALRERG